MSLAESLSHFIHWFGVARRPSDFMCGDCKRVETCGMPPSQDCVVRLEQIERNRSLGWAIRREPSRAESVGRAAQDRFSAVSGQDNY